MWVAKDSFWLKLAACGLLIFTVRLWLIQAFGSSLPYWDQWDSLAADLFLKWSENHFSIEQLFAPHNEHRIIFPRLLALGLFSLNESQWQPLFEMVVNAGLAALAAMFLSVLLRRYLLQQQDNILLLTISMLWILPFGWENTLAGFQSAFYFMLLFSFIAIWGLVLHSPYQWQWWVGALVGFCAFFNVASGLLIFIAIFSVKLYQLWLDKNHAQQYIPTLLICLVILCLEFALLVPAPHHAGLKPQDFIQFLLAFSKALAFPAITHPFFSLLAFFPFFIFVTRLLWLRRPLTMAETLLLTLGVWIVLQAASMAYARGANGAVPASRYVDILAIAILVNLLSFFVLMPMLVQRVRQVLLGIFTLWFIGNVFFMCELLQETVLPALLTKSHNNVLQLQNTVAFLQTQDINTLKNKNIPYPNADRLALLLSNPNIRRFLPPSLQNPALLTNQKADNTFITNGFYPTTGTYQGSKTLGSYNQQGNNAEGTFLSEPLTIEQSFIEIAVAGYLGETGLRLGIWVEGENEPRWLQTTQLSRETWITYQIQNPNKPFSVIAIDENPQYWFAFSMPYGVGRANRWTIWLLNHVDWLLALSLCLLLLPSTFRRLDKATLTTPS
ncbi:hypothetical protein BegalDRAFT_2565 [Beggiatoa alba B18LD]|uniref:Glycosyltransferase RgtA/B/C/D-like domain-containing protein n=1 Tax=Beggiatoa alba B18LD TaxID=395493 RepID=I3CIG5_9GAMM|nr:hypothetical protein [Beggiatoa alba]EIJ43408.1 hypothetical protein BegalDRAFT_2565 [Beggiatoa alba B18LD]